jgi:hypothetical protein
VLLTGCLACLDVISFKVFRCQLPKDNPYYEAKSDEAIEEDPEAAQYISHIPEKGNRSVLHRFLLLSFSFLLRHSPLFTTDVLSVYSVSAVFFCAECGMKAEKRCSACRQVHYCTVTHQREHWGRGHKEECEELKARAEGKAANGKKAKATPPAAKPPPALFDEWEVITEEEPSEDEDEAGEDYEKKLSRKYKELKQLHKMQAKGRVRQGPSQLPEDFPVPEEPVEDGPIDDSFINFQHRAKRAPDQVLR